MKTTHDVHILYRLPGRPLNQIIYSGNNNNSTGMLITNHPDITEVRPSHIGSIWQLSPRHNADKIFILVPLLVLKIVP